MEDDWSEKDDDDNEYNTDDEARNQPTSKRAKRGRNRFNDEWKKLFSWIVAGKSEFYGKSIYCKSEVSISVSEVTDVKRHMNTAKHQNNMKAATGSKNISTFFSTPTQSLSSAATDGTFDYHTIQHAHSYNSANCSSTLYSTMFSDSKIASDFSCDRTKCPRIVTNVLVIIVRKILLIT